MDLADKAGRLLHAHEPEDVAFELPFMLADRLFDSRFWILSKELALAAPTH